jgi:hypothetical protein
MRNLLSSLFNGFRTRNQVVRPKARPRLEVLEDRCVPAVTADLVNGFNDDREFFDSDDPDLIDTGNPSEDFIRNLYLIELGRDAAPSEVALWLPVLNTAGRAAVANGIDLSLEAATRRVAIWYAEFLGRVPNDTEAAGAIAALQAGAPDEAVLVGILSSDEFFAVANNEFGTQNDVRSFVRGLFEFVLDRDGSDGEVDLYVNVVNNFGRAQAATFFVTSTEFRQDATDEFYEVFLDRGADDGEEDLWANTVQSLQQVRVGIAASDEFFSRDD